MKIQILLALLVAGFTSLNAVASINGVNAKPNTVNAGEEIVITVTEDMAKQNHCGLSVEFGDGEVREIKIDAKEGLFPRILTKAYVKPGTYTLSVTGKFISRGFSSYSACEGKAVATITVASSPQANIGVTPVQNQATKGNVGTGRRVALVIGNGNYKHPESLPTLSNPTHDAEDIAQALRGFGFEVIEKKDQSLEGMSEAISEFGRKITDSDAALFYYAGHGLQVKGQNYIIPVDAKFESEAQVPFRSINVNQLLDEMDNGKSRANIVMLDACRNNPISGKFRSGATRGLAAPSSQPKGTVIVYATDPGNTAADGDGRNGLFTAGLLTAFKGNDLSLHGVLVRTSKEVERGSEQKQTPYINGPATLQEDFQFAPMKATQIANSEPAPAQAQPAARAKTKEEIEDNYWEEIKNSNDLASFEQYRKDYPKGRYINPANLKIAQLKKKTQETALVKPPPTTTQPVVRSKKSVEEIEDDTWSAAEAANTPEAINAYLAGYPNGRYMTQAKVKLASLNKTAQEIKPEVAPARAEAEENPEAALWAEVQNGNTKDDYEAYLAQYPKGNYASLARIRIKKLRDEANAANSRKAGSEETNKTILNLFGTAINAAGRK